MTTLSERAVGTLVQGTRLLWLLRDRLRLRSDQMVFEALLDNPDDRRLQEAAQQTLQEAIDDDRVDTAELTTVLPRRGSLTMAVLALAVPAMLILLILVAYFLPSHGQKWVTMEYFCVGVLPVVEASLSFMFVGCLSWAVILYSRVRDIAVGLSFHQLANVHKLWSQVWFTISIAIFLGGLIYAIFHVGESLCSENYWISADACTASSEANVSAPSVSRPLDGGGSGNTGQQQGAQEELQRPTAPEGAGGVNDQRAKDPWVEAIRTILPNIFIFSLFFVIWQWSAKHYRVHWHNYVNNVFRHRALVKIAALEGGMNIFTSPLKRDETVSDLRIMAAMLLLLPMRSAYAEKGEEAGETGAERLIKVEEMLREIITRRNK